MPNLFFAVSKTSAPLTSLALLLFLLFLTSPISAVAQTEKPESTAQETKVTLQAIADITVQVEASTDVDDALRSELKSRLQRATTALNDSAKHEQAATDFQKMVTGAAQQTRQLASDLESNDEQSIPPGSMSLEALRIRLAEAESELATALKRTQELAAEPARRQTRLSQIPDELISANESLEEIAQQRAQADPANETVLETQTRKMLLDAKQTQFRNLIRELELERSAYKATRETLPLRQQLAERKVSRLRTEVERLQKLQTEKQKHKVEDVTRSMQRVVETVPDELKELAQSNVTLAERQQELIADAAVAMKNIRAITEALDNVTKELATSAQRVEAVGLTDALGTMFRERRHEFAEMARNYQPKLDIAARIESLQTESFDLEDKIQKVDAQLKQVGSKEVDWKPGQVNWESLSGSDARWVLLKQHRQLLGETLQANNQLLQLIIDSDFQRRELSQATDDYLAFVDRRLFWTRSVSFFSFNELKNLPEAASWLTQPASLKSLMLALGRSFQVSPLASVLISLLTLALVIWRSRMRRFIEQQGKLANRYNSTFRPTLYALAATAIAASAWPAAIAGVGTLLMNGATDIYVQTFGASLGLVAVFVASRELLREVCRQQGLADAHLGWSQKLRRHLRIHLFWYTIVGSVCVFFMSMLGSHPEGDVRILGTRLAAVLLFVVIALFHHIIFRTSGPLYEDVLRHNQNSPVFRVRNFTWAVLVLLPLSFSILALAGYLDTVTRLGRLVQLSLLWLVSILLILGLIYRWISLYRRKVLRRQAREAWEKQQALAAQSDEGGEVVQSPRDDLQSADLPALDQRTRQTAWVLAIFAALVGLALLWRDMLPAVEYFGELKIWGVGTGDNIEIVTLLDLILSGLVVLGLIFAARNFASLLELVVLSRTSMDSGGRYALVTLLRYFLFVVGAVAVFRLLSIPTQQLGWLLAAASVGIGFGLQEVIANFVCGIILLLERPVRVGDIVTIGQTTGTISRIQMRATTVVNWDRKELIIPNKDLVTKEVLNWTLSNVVNRMTLAVGVQYGADPDIVREILSNVVDEHPKILKDPAPMINLESFGDSALNFIMRFYLPDLDNRIAITHEINTAITRALDQAGVAIPFPQRDVNLRVISDHEPIPVAMSNGNNR